MRLRVNDPDFGHSAVTVRDDKADKDRRMPLAQPLCDLLRQLGMLLQPNPNARPSR